MLEEIDYNAVILDLDFTVADCTRLDYAVIVCKVFLNTIGQFMPRTVIHIKVFVHLNEKFSISVPPAMPTCQA